MVWWIDNYRNRNRKRGSHLEFRRLHDRIFPSLNIMFNCHKSYDAYDLYMLTTVGVNIFNVDLTVHDKEYFDRVKTAVLGAEKIPEKYPSLYYKPVAFSVVVSINNVPNNIYERVDIIIMKDLTKAAQLLEFRKQNASFSSMPILFWLSTFEIEDLNELIKISDGVVVDENITERDYYDILQISSDSCKPVFHVQATLTDDYYEATATDLQMLTIANKLVQDRVSGVLVFDEDASKPSPIDALRSFAKATDIAEGDVKAFQDYFNLSFRLMIPILPPRATALSASLAALQCGASAIVVLTTTGTSAKLLSSSSPPCPVLAITTHERTVRRMHLYRKVIPVLYNSGTQTASWQEEVRNRTSFGARIAIETGVCSAGSKLVVLSQAEQDAGYCNTFQIIVFPFRCVY